MVETKKRHQRTELFLRISGEPILTTQAIHAGKITKVSRNDCESVATGVACDHQIIRADHHAPPLKVGANVSEMGGCVLIKGQDRKAGRQPLHFAPSFDRTRRLGRAIKQLSQIDGRDAEPIRFRVEPCASAWRTVTQHANTDVGVEHEAQHFRRIPGPGRRAGHDSGNQRLESRKSRPTGFPPEQ
jgi:hypothetical protein